MPRKSMRSHQLTTHIMARMIDPTWSLYLFVSLWIRKKYYYCLFVTWDASQIWARETSRTWGNYIGYLENIEMHDSVQYPTQTLNDSILLRTANRNILSPSSNRFTVLGWLSTLYCSLHHWSWTILVTKTNDFMQRQPFSEMNDVISKTELKRTIWLVLNLNLLFRDYPPAILFSTAIGTS